MLGDQHTAFEPGHGFTGRQGTRGARQDRHRRRLDAGSLTNFDKVLFPAPASNHRSRSATSSATTRGSPRPCCPVSPAGRSPCTATPTASTTPASGTGRSPATFPDWLTRRRNYEADPGETQRARLAGQLRRRRVAPVDLPAAGRAPTDLGADRHRPGRRHQLRRRPRARATLPDGAGAPRRRRNAGGHRQARHPDPNTGSPRPHLRRHPQTGRSGLPGRGPNRARTGQPAVVPASARRPRPARLHAERHQQDLVAPFGTRPAPGAPVSVPIAWDELDDPDLRPDGWTIRTALDRIRDGGDPLAPLIDRRQELPALCSRRSLLLRPACGGGTNLPRCPHRYERSSRSFPGSS